MNCSYVALVPHISYMGEKENALFFGQGHEKHIFLQILLIMLTRSCDINEVLNDHGDEGQGGPHAVPVVPSQVRSVQQIWMNEHSSLRV